MKLIKVFTSLLVIISSTLYAEKSSKDEIKEIISPKADALQSKLNSMMQNTASWLDNIYFDDGQVVDGQHKEASATGYLQLSWIPRTANLDDVDAKFKVYFDLPKWSDKLALVIDNDDEDELLLDYESDHSQTNQEGINVAIQYIKQFNQQRQVRNRIGISRKQLYLRSEMLFNWKIKKFAVRLQPRIDYFLQDGWGPSVKGVVNYPLDNSYLSLSATWQKIQNESRSRHKLGFFHIKNTGRNQLLVSGIQYNKSINKEDVSNENYIISMRYRNLIYKSWMYFELEPFIEFNELNDFRREVGIALNLISYYGD